MSDDLHQKALPVPRSAYGKDEMNLAEFPIARLGRNDTRKTIKYSGRIVDKAGKVQEQVWIATGSDLFGLPTEFAERVLMALIFITAEASFVSRKVPFTIYRVLQMLGQTDNYRNYKAVIHALQQLVGVTLYSDRAFYEKSNTRRITTYKGFHLLDEFWVKSLEINEEIIEEEGVNGYVIWGERIWESFKSGYIKNLDADFYYSLENPIARRLYRFLDKRMHYQDEYQIDVFDLAGRLGMSSYRYPSDIIHKVRPGLEELQGRGYLAGVETVKVGKFTRLKFRRNRAFADARETASEAYRDVETDSTEEDALDHEEMPLAGLYARYGTPDQLKSLWAKLLQECEHSLPYSTYTMLADSALLNVAEEIALLAIAKPYRGWIERQMNRQIRSLLNQHLESGEKVRELAFVEF